MNENPSATGTFTYNARFPGQVYDRETNLHHNGFRDFDPQTGRYVEPDPIGLAGGSFSTYNYVGGNPLSYVDSNGTVAIPMIIPTVIIGAGALWWIYTHPVKAPGGGYSDPFHSDRYAPGFVDAERGARDWGKRNGVPNAVDIFHDIKKGDRGRPGSKAGDNCSVNPDTGEVHNGTGEHIGDLGDGH